MDDAWINAFREKHPHKHEDAKKDFDDAASVTNHLKNVFTLKFEQGGYYEDNLMKANFKPSETDGINPEEVDTAMEDIAEAYKSIFSNKSYINELMNLNEADITDLLVKNPMGKKILDFLILGIKALFFPLATLVEIASETAAEKLLPMTSKISSAIGGPGPFEFPILSYIVLESYQIFAYGIKGTFSFETILDIVLAGLKPWGDLITVAIQVAHAIVLAWAVLSVLQHIRSLFDKNFGKESETTTATESYKQNGKFKLRDGNLLFVS